MGILQVDNIIAQSTANTVTLGVSGNTINIPAGVTFNVSSGSITLPNGSVTNAQLQNSTITINGSVVPLGTSTTIIYWRSLGIQQFKQQILQHRLMLVTW
jgi:hypothetical protein